MWEALADFSEDINGTVMTVRLSKSTDSFKPKYTVALGVLTHEGFRPYLRADILDTSKDALTSLSKLFQNATAKMVIDRDAFFAADKEKKEKAERERQQAISGKSGGDPNANKGLSRFKKKQQKSFEG